MNKRAYDKVKKASEKHLKELAVQLALNYVDASAIDLFQDKTKEGIRRELKKQRNFVFQNESAKDYYEKGNVKNYTGRNILVLGAGCTFNAFSDIPLGNEVKEMLLEKIVIWGSIDGNTPGYGEGNAPIDFLFFARFVLEFFEYRNLTSKKRFKEKTYIKLLGEKENKEENRKKLVFLDNIFSSEFSDSSREPEYSDGLNTQHLLSALGLKYYSELQRLNRDSIVKGEKGECRFDSVDFETSLFLLEQIFPISMVRQNIKNIFNYSSGSIAFYELIAHLFKNRFIDVIINFNFDEFLDNALDDELGRDGYEKILSDGDCRPLGEFSPTGRLRQPLYIKPHGTASHKSTLRFTKNQYHDTPSDMRAFLEEVISCGSKGDIQIKKHVNLITVGFNMESVEFNTILKKNLPEGSTVFSFFHHDDSCEERFSKLEEALTGRMEKLSSKLSCIKKNKFLLEGKNEEKKWTFKLIGHEFFREGPFKLKGRDPLNLHSGIPSLGNVMLLLYSHIQDCFVERFKPRNIDEHQIVINLFGTEQFYDSVRTGKEKKESHVYPKSYFNSSGYYQDRVMIEILIALSNDNGCIAPSDLMKGRCGKYYAMYQVAFARELESLKERLKTLKKKLKTSKKEKKTLKKKLKEKGKEAKPLDKFLNSCLNVKIGGSKSGDPNMLSNYIIIDKSDLKTDIEKVFKNSRILMFSNKMNDYLSDVNDPSSSKERHNPIVLDSVIGAYSNLSDSNYSKVSSKFRSASHHIFKDYETTNLLNTDLAMDLHFNKALKDKKDKTIDVDTLRIVADNGTQLFKFLGKLLKRKIKVEIILDTAGIGIHSDQKNKDKIKTHLEKHKKEFFKKCKKVLRKRGKGKTKKEVKAKIKLFFLEPHEHNQHMALFIKSESEKEIKIPTKAWENRGIYYQKVGFSKYINPIRLIEPDNIVELNNLFKETKDRANEYYPELN